MKSLKRLPQITTPDSQLCQLTWETEEPLATIGDWNSREDGMSSSSTMTTSIIPTPYVLFTVPLKRLK
jgi:hypothetical protein